MHHLLLAMIIYGHTACFLVISLECWPHLKCLSSLLRQGAQLVPQVTDALAALVHSSHVMVIQLTGKKRKEAFTAVCFGFEKHYSIKKKK